MSSSPRHPLAAAILQISPLEVQAPVCPLRTLGQATLERASDLASAAAEPGQVGRIWRQTTLEMLAAIGRAF